MKTAARKAMARLAMVVVVGTWVPAAEGSESDTAPADTLVITRVRSDQAAVRVLIQETARRSPTFGQIIEAIERTNGVVYVSRKRCRLGVRACLLHKVVIAGPNRLLHIVIDDRMSDVDVMGSLGHELRHAQEVLEDPTVTSGPAMYSFYDRHASRRFGNGFETEAAIAAGDAVRAEVRKHDSR